MNITLLQEHLSTALSRVGKIVTPKTQLPILGMVLLETKDNQLRMVTTNTETTCVSWVGAKVTKEGGVCVPVKLLSEFVLSLPSDKVTLETKENNLTISCGGFTATIPGVGKDEFPPVPEKKKEASKTKKDIFVKSIGAVLSAAATDEGRPILTGVKIQKKDGDMVLAATDGYRLSVKRSDVGISGLTDIVIPARALSEIVRVSMEEKETDTVEIAVIGDGQLGFYLGNTEIYTRAIDGEYPNYEKIIPKTTTTKAVLDHEVFLRAVKSAAIFARDNANIIKLHFEKDEVVISANTPQVGENTVTVSTKIEGEDQDIAFNSRFLLEFLGSIDEEKIVFEMTGSLNPGVFKIEGDDSFFHIIMPVRVQS